MAANHTTSCSPALFTDGRDERDGAGWLLGYWALSTNGRPRQGRFHAPPPRRQPSEQHSHLSTVRCPHCVRSLSPFVWNNDIHKGLTRCLWISCCSLLNPEWRMFGTRLRTTNFYNHWLHFALGDVVATMMSTSISWQYFRVKHVNVLLTCWPPGLGSQGPQQGKVRPFIPFFFFSPNCFAFLFPLSLFHLHGGVFGNAVALFSIPHPHPC